MMVAPKSNRMLLDWDMDSLCSAVLNTKDLEAETAKQEYAAWKRLREEKRLKEEKRRPTVTFVSNVDVWEIPNCSYLTKKEKEELWYPEPVREVDGTIKSKSIDTPRDILSRLSCRESKRRRKVYNASEESLDDMQDDLGRLNSIPGVTNLPVVAVLDEQQSQREEGWNDPEIISKMYIQCSSHSAVLAQMRAFNDEQDIREYKLSEDVTEKRSRLSSLFRTRKR